MNVFVLCAGRCGSVTFSKACEHIANYSVGHESRHNHILRNNMRYPDNHIEVDLHLAWRLGLLDRYHNKDVFYVHLFRDEDKVASSFYRKFSDAYQVCPKRGPHGVGRAWWEFLGCPEDDPPGMRLKTMLDMVLGINLNINHFLRDKPNIFINIENAKEKFPLFFQKIGAEGDVGGAAAEFDLRYNSSANPGAAICV